MHMHMAIEGEELVREYAVSISAVHEVYLIIHQVHFLWNNGQLTGLSIEPQVGRN